MPHKNSLYEATFSAKRIFLPPRVVDDLVRSLDYLAELKASIAMV